MKSILKVAAIAALWTLLSASNSRSGALSAGLPAFGLQQRRPLKQFQTPKGDNP